MPAAAWLYQVWGITDAADVTTRNFAARDIRDSLAALNKVLAPKTFLVGEQVTIADIAVVIALLDLYRTVLDNNFRRKFLNVARWLDTVLNQPHFLDIVGPVSFCEAMPGAPLPDDLFGVVADQVAAPASTEATSDAAAPASAEAVASTPAEGAEAVPAAVPVEEAPSDSSAHVADGAAPAAESTTAAASTPSATEAAVAPAAAESTEASALSADLVHSSLATQPPKQRGSWANVKPPVPVQAAEAPAAQPAAAAPQDEKVEVHGGVALKPFGTATRVEFEIKAGGPEQGGGFASLFTGKKGAKEIWLQINEIKGKLSDEQVTSVQTLIKAERSTQSKKKTTAYFLFQDQAVADALLAQKSLVLYVQN